MMYGLTTSELSSLISVLTANSLIEKAVLFGSRAKGNFKNGSDIDIALFSDKMTFNEFIDLQIELEKVDVLQKIDALLFNRIDNADLIDHINRVGKVIYQK